MKIADQIVRMMMDMVGLQWRGGHMDGLHAHRMGRCQIARIVLEHRG